MYGDTLCYYTAPESNMTSFTTGGICLLPSNNGYYAFDIYKNVIYVVLFSTTYNLIYLIKKDITIVDPLYIGPVSGPSIYKFIALRCAYSFAYNKLYVGGWWDGGSLSEQGVICIDLSNLTWDVVKTGGPCDSLDISACGKYLLVGYNHNAEVYDANTFEYLSYGLGDTEDFVFRFCGMYSSLIVSNTGYVYESEVPLPGFVKWVAEVGEFPWTEPDGSVNCDTLSTLWDLHEETTNKGARQTSVGPRRCYGR